jgi:hypothetical protein
MNDVTFWKRISLFFSYLPKTIKETFIWFLFSYLIPLLNIGLIWAIQGNQFNMSIDIYSIIIITNACFFTSLYHLAFDSEKANNHSKSEKDRKLVKTINLVTYVATVVLFTVTIIQTEKSFEIFNIQVFKMGAFLTFVIALFLGLISKYDEIEAMGLERAKTGKAQSETRISNKKIKL